MRRALALLGVAILAAAFAAPVSAKEMSVSLGSGGPASTDPGEPWNADLLVHGEPELLAQATPGISIRGPNGEERTFEARRTGRRATDGQLIFRTTVTFPSEGRWTYQLLDGLSDRAYEGGIVLVGDVTTAPAADPAPQAPSPAPAAAGDDSFPLWPLLGGLLAAGVAAIVAVALVRRGRLAPER